VTAVAISLPFQRFDPILGDPIEPGRPARGVTQAPRVRLRPVAKRTVASRILRRNVVGVLVELNVAENFRGLSANKYFFLAMGKRVVYSLSDWYKIPAW